MAREQAREHRDQLGRHLVLAPRAGAAAVSEMHRRAEIEQKPRRDFPFLVVFPDVGRLQARRDVPVDAAHVVVILVLAQVREIQASGSRRATARRAGAVRSTPAAAAAVPDPALAARQAAPVGGR